MIDYKIENRVGMITLNRPEKRNALDASMVAELTQTFEKAKNDTSVKVIILKAEGKVFCAGADLESLQKLQKNTFDENLTGSTALKDLFYLIYTFPKVIIAQVQGAALAGGCGLASVCDVVFAVPEAKFGYTEVRIGFVPAIVTVFLIRKIGESQAKRLLLSADLIDTATAQSYGLVHFIVEKEQIAYQTHEYAQMLVQKNSAQAMTHTKDLIIQLQHLPLEEALAEAAQQNALARATTDCQKGIAAFLNKEELSW